VWKSIGFEWLGSALEGGGFRDGVWERKKWNEMAVNGGAVWKALIYRRDCMACLPATSCEPAAW
jgi:hypothetical protein